jgi:hypothetical protein
MEEKLEEIESGDYNRILKYLYQLKIFPIISNEGVQDRSKI